MSGKLVQIMGHICKNKCIFLMYNKINVKIFKEYSIQAIDSHWFIDDVYYWVCDIWIYNGKCKFTNEVQTITLASDIYTFPGEILQCQRDWERLSEIK